MGLTVGRLGSPLQNEYTELKMRLQKLGIPCTGDIATDASQLESVKEEDYNNSIKNLDKQNKEQEDFLINKQLMEERTGAQTLGEQNRIFFNI